MELLFGIEKIKLIISEINSLVKQSTKAVYLVFSFQKIVRPAVSCSHNLPLSDELDQENLIYFFLSPRGIYLLLFQSLISFYIEYFSCS